MTRKSELRPIWVAALLLLGLSVILACGGMEGNGTGQVADTPTSMPADTPVAMATATTKPSDTPVAMATATTKPSDTPVPSATAAPEPTYTPMPTSALTVVDEYGFVLQLTGDVPVQVSGWVAESPTTKQGVVRFVDEGVRAVLTWYQSSYTPQQIVADGYQKLKEAQPDFVFEPLNDGSVGVSGERGLYGGFKVMDAASVTLGGGLVTGWVCPESQTRYSLTLTGASATVVQVRLFAILDKFSCS